MFVLAGHCVVWLSDSHSLKVWLFVSNLFATPVSRVNGIIIIIPFYRHKNELSKFAHNPLCIILAYIIVLYKSFFSIIINYMPLAQGWRTSLTQRAKLLNCESQRATPRSDLPKQTLTQKHIILTIIY